MATVKGERRRDRGDERGRPYIIMRGLAARELALEASVAERRDRGLRNGRTNRKYTMPNIVRNSFRPCGKVSGYFKNQREV